MDNNATPSGVDTPGELATQLILELKNSPITLPCYNHAIIRAVILEQRSLEAELTRMALSDATRPFSAPSQLPSAFVLSSIVNRNKRCLLAYHEHRLNRIKDIFWDRGGALHFILSDTQLKGALSLSEVEFLKSYSTSMQVYQSDVGISLFSPIEAPPKSLYANVRVIRECGKVSTEHGTVDFRMGTRYTLYRADIEFLIVQGYLEEV